jgi:glucose-1-phosphate cytidylyltransferase
MKAIILAGGLGTRISEESHLKPKPMIEIGNKPILWHLMKIYSSFGINDFVICLGYKGYVIKEYFLNYSLHSSDVTISLKDNSLLVHQKYSEPWNITLIDTGEMSMTGGRLKRIKEYVNNETFCFTYGDGLSDINITDLINTHKKNNLKATVTAVQPPGRYGILKISENLATVFTEKPTSDNDWINGGFFVLEPSIFNYIDGDNTIWENEPIKKLIFDKELGVYKHYGFWQCMDTLRDKNYLDELWQRNKAPWKSW